MFKKLWHYLINSFLVSTASNYKKALVLGVDHEAKLSAHQTIPEIMALLTNYVPVLQSFKATDVNLRVALGEYKGETQTVEELFDHLNKILLPSWEIQIFTLYPKGSVNATILLPQGRKPFQNGTYESRIQEIKALGDKPLLMSSLPALSTAVLAFHVQIESARQLQQSAGEGQVRALRTLRETARVSMCQAMFGNLGMLMHYYRTNPAQVADYFDLTLLRKKSKPGVSVASGTVSDAQTGMAISNASVKFIIAGQENITVQTNANGQFEAELGTFTETITGTMEVTASGYTPYTDTGSIEPGEDYETEVNLEPEPMPPTPPMP